MRRVICCVSAGFDGLGLPMFQASKEYRLRRGGGGGGGSIASWTRTGGAAGNVRRQRRDQGGCSVSLARHLRWPPEQQTIERFITAAYSPQRVEMRVTESECFVVEGDEGIVAFADAVAHEDHVGLQAIYALPELRGRGAGTALLQRSSNCSPSNPSRPMCYPVTERARPSTSARALCRVSGSTQSCLTSRSWNDAGGALPRTRGRPRCWVNLDSGVSVTGRPSGWQGGSVRRDRGAVRLACEAPAPIYSAAQRAH